jgi:hypothetical protein
MCCEQARLSQPVQYRFGVKALAIDLVRQRGEIVVDDTTYFGPRSVF